MNRLVRVIVTEDVPPDALFVVGGVRIVAERDENLRHSDQHYIRIHIRIREGEAKREAQVAACREYEQTLVERAEGAEGERKRMLDLLERAREVLRRAEVRMDRSGRSPLRREIEALLREHDRLQGEAVDG